jgi:hypothetical protein
MVNAQADARISIADESTMAEGDDKKVASLRATLKTQPQETPKPETTAPATVNQPTN